MIDLSIILVNWNSIAYAEQCIESIQATVHGPQYEVIVIDNASMDAPCKRLTERLPFVKLTLSQTNLGFGGANNLGARQSSGKVLLFLNPDTILQGDAVERMLHALSAAPDAGAIGCRLLNRDRSLQTSSVQSFPTVLNQIFAIGFLQRLCPALPLWGKQALYCARREQAHAVDVVSGACLMVRREIFEELGGFNPAYFMYAEEVDLCFMIRAAGKQILHCPSAEVIHFGGQSTRQREDGFADIAMRESVYRFLRRTRGANHAILFRTGLGLSAAIRIGLLTLMRPLVAACNWPLTLVRAERKKLKWMRIVRWCLGQQPEEKPSPAGKDAVSARREQNYL